MHENDNSFFDKKETQKRQILLARGVCPPKRLEVHHAGINDICVSRFLKTEYSEVVSPARPTEIN